MHDRIIKHIDTLNDLLDLRLKFINYLERKGLQFDENGIPILKSEYFLDDYPNLIVPIDHRKDRIVTNKKKTALCFYCSDIIIFRRLAKLLDEIDIYKEYMGVIAFDITVTRDMDIEYQELIMEINLLAVAVLCVNGIKCILNTRIGSFRTLRLLENIPKNIMWASGFLGCSKDEKDDNSYIDKILTILPSKLIIYGKTDSCQNTKLDLMGIEYKYYKDFHTISKEVSI